jgi:hypothetical protein
MHNTPPLQLTPSKQALRTLALDLLPGISELVGVMNRSGGRVVLPDRLRSAVVRLKVSGYVRVYESESHIAFAYLKWIDPDGTLLEELTELSRQPVEAQREALDSCIQAVTSPTYSSTLELAVDEFLTIGGCKEFCVD